MDRAACDEGTQVARFNVKVMVAIISLKGLVAARIRRWSA
jgi:hypothetical protein